MARANLNKSVWLVTNTTTASKYIPKRTRICINWNPTFQTQIYLVKVLLNVNIVKQDLLRKKRFLKILWSEVWKGGFQLMLILVLLRMYFDAVVVFVTSYFYSDWLWPYYAPLKIQIWSPEVKNISIQVYLSTSLISNHMSSFLGTSLALMKASKFVVKTLVPNSEMISPHYVGQVL